MELEVGMYVRTKHNINNPSFIAKIIKIETKKMLFGELGLCITFDNKKEGFYENNITKHSKNIIDLIEVGDYVNGRLVCNVGKGNKYIYLVDFPDLINIKANDEIRTILTKQQFESNAYKIEKER